MKRFLAIAAAIALMTMALPAGAASSQFPEVIPLPDGIAPEGIVSGNGTEFFVGSLANGTIYKGDFRTGAGGYINDATDFDARTAVGLDFDSRTGAVWVAGGDTGSGYVYDGDTGETIAVLTLATSTPTFVNDVVVTGDTAYFTESAQQILYSVDLDRRGLPILSTVEALPLTGDYEFFPGQFNANGIVASPGGNTLIIVNSFAGALYTVDGDTGATLEIDLGSGSVVSGDGMLLDGKTLYVVQNFLNQISVVELSSDFTSGNVTGAITDSDFMIPTTVAEFGNSLYAVNARFDVTPTPTTEFDVVRVGK